MANNLSLNETFQGIGNAVQNIGAIAAKERRSKKAVDVNKYKNVTGNMSTAQSTPAMTNTSGLLNQGTVTTPFGGSTRYEGFHPGLDIASGMNAPVKSEAPGKVIKVDTGKKQGDKGFGNSVIVEDAYGNKFRYSHLNQAWVKVGDTLTRGSVIGAQGNSGSTYSTSGGSGEHLDLRIQDAYNRYINPTSYIQNLNRHG